MSTSPTPPAPLSLTPDPQAWAALARSRTTPTQAPEFRRQLGLPAAGPIVMSGHQIEWWHPGILAKRLAALAAARAMRATAAWLNVDQDSTDPGLVRYPARRAGTLARAEWRMGPMLGAKLDLPPASRGPLTPVAVGAAPRDGAADFVNDGLARIAAAVAAHASADSLAQQMTLAMEDLLAQHGWAMTALPATAMARTALFAEVVGRMQADPAGCIQAYNAAALAHPRARLKPLAEPRGELPLWQVRPGEPRRRVTAALLASIPREQLAPRALLMTGLARFAACDLFIHGLGGAIYDPATELWLSRWLGWNLAPAVTATATLLLPLHAGDFVSAQEADRAVWTAHHARHEPALLGDDWASRRKRELVEDIQRAVAEGTAAGPEFERMQELLSRVRLENAQRLHLLEIQAAAAKSASDSWAIASDRTWPWALSPPPALSMLAERIQDLFDRNAHAR